MRKTALLLVLAFAVAGAVGAGGCRDEEQEELDRQIQSQIEIVDKEMKAVEAHQASLRAMIKEMQTQLDAMQAELNAEAPRLNASQKAMISLRDLTLHGFGESAAESTMREPAWSWSNVLWIALFLFVIWLLYRYMLRGRTKE